MNIGLQLSRQIVKRTNWNAALEFQNWKQTIVIANRTKPGVDNRQCGSCNSLPTLQWILFLLTPCRSNVSDINKLVRMISSENFSSCFCSTGTCALPTVTSDFLQASPIFLFSTIWNDKPTFVIQNMRFFLNNTAKWTQNASILIPRQLFL